MRSPPPPKTERANVKLQAHPYLVRPASYRHVILVEAEKVDS
jgi:hypothetical protein